MNVRVFLLVVAATGLAGLGCLPPDDGDAETGVPSDGSVGDAPDGVDRDVGDVDGGEALDGGDGTDGGESLEEIHLEPVGPTIAEGFATSVDCKSCHANVDGTDAMRDSQGNGVAPYDLWQASMMANAARDPFWRAAVSAEVETSPGASEAIEDKCLNCHSPMAYTAKRRRGEGRIALSDLEGRDDVARLAVDGVSCTSCHLMEPDGLGEPASFSGNFVMNDQKQVYGPFADPHGEPMSQQTGFEPVQGEHIKDSGTCGSCHTLYTDPIDAQGESTAEGHFPEQTPFIEWKNSVYSDDAEEPTRECQGCHEPTDDRQGNPIETQIAVSKYGSDYSLEDVPKRSPYGRHLFVGGNTLVPQMIRDNADALSPRATEEAFDELIERTRRQLENRTATLEVADASLESGTLAVDLAIETMTGHKFPTGYPSRRAWLHVEVENADGEVVFASGRVDDQGRLTDGEGEPLAVESQGGPISPHRDVVDAEDEAQIYQAVMEDADGETTFRLMRAADYEKDNRLLPKGWSSDHPSIDDIEAIGTDGDDDFSAGGDEVTFEVDVSSAGGGPYEVRAALRYQTLAYRYAQELFAVDTLAVRVFRRYWSEADRSPETIDTAETEVE